MQSVPNMPLGQHSKSMDEGDLRGRRRTIAEARSPLSRDVSLDEIELSPSNLNFEAELAKRRVSVMASNRRRLPTINKGGNYLAAKNRASSLFDSGDDFSLPTSPTSPSSAASQTQSPSGSPIPPIAEQSSSPPPPPTDGGAASASAPASGKKPGPPPVAKKPPKPTPEKGSSSSLESVLSKGRPGVASPPSGAGESPAPAPSGEEEAPLRTAAKPNVAAKRMSSAVAMELNGLLMAGIKPGAGRPLLRSAKTEEETES